MNVYRVCIRENIFPCKTFFAFPFFTGTLENSCFCEVIKVTSLPVVCILSAFYHPFLLMFELRVEVD